MFIALPESFPEVSMISFTFFTPQSNCSHILAWLFALLFFRLYSCTFFIDSSQNFSVLVLPLPHFHYLGLLYASLNVVQNCNLFYHHDFSVSSLIVIFILALFEIGFTSGSIYWKSDCGSTVIDPCDRLDVRKSGPASVHCKGSLKRHGNRGRAACWSLNYAQLGLNAASTSREKRPVRQSSHGREKKKLG